MKRLKLEGVIVPLLTPLRPDESLDEAGLERLIEHTLKGGASGVFLLGSTGEFALLSHETRFHLIRAARRIIKGRVPVLVGISEPGTRSAIAFGRRVVELGAEAVVATAPFYYNHSQTDLVAHFAAIAEDVAGPLVLYNIPRNVKVSLAAETVKRLMEIPNIIGLKDSAGELERAWRLQAQIGELISIHKHKSGPAGIKAACHLMGLCGPTAAAPFEELSEEQVAQVRQTLVGLELLPHASPPL
ncbi:MAG: dihydrodipicolinate synthase family protein [Blastocatellia bacterium]